MRIEVKQKIDPCISLSAEGNHYRELIEDEMKGQIIDRLWELIEPYIHTDESYHEIKMTLNVNTLVENAVSFKDGYPQYGKREYLKIW